MAKQKQKMYYDTKHGAAATRTDNNSLQEHHPLNNVLLGHYQLKYLTRTDDSVPIGHHPLNNVP